MAQRNISRRRLLKNLAAASAATLATQALFGCSSPGSAREPLYRVSLAQWSLHRRFQSGAADPMAFASIAREEFGLEGVEYVNQFYMDSLNERVVSELRNRADSEGVQSLLIMVDREGALGDPDPKARRLAVQNHHRWADAARELGCHSIRVNAQSAGSYQEQMARAADGLVQLAEYCTPLGLNVIVENHGGLSSNGQWLADVMRTADQPRVGTLPDFGNFVINRTTGERYDAYLGVDQLMPFARGVSAKSHSFDERGYEEEIDYRRMMQVVLAHGFRGWVGVEYEGDRHSEAEGIALTRDLLLRLESEFRERV